MKWFEDIFTKSKLMIISGIISVIVNLALVVISAINHAPLIAQYLIFAFLPALILLCYKKGETSAQKALIGAVLGIVMYANWTMLSGTYELGSSGIVTLGAFLTVFYTILFINHILLQIDHKGDKQIILASQIMLIVAIIWQFAEMIAQLFNGGQYYNILSSIGFLSLVTMITCVEARIQKYKARRSAAMASGTWTEEERQKSKKIFKF